VEDELLDVFLEHEAKTGGDDPPDGP